MHAKLNVIDFGVVSPIQSQAVYHGVADAMTSDSTPTLILVRPNSRYVCVGMHQNIDVEIDSIFCIERQIPVIRRATGGGTVLLDQDQLFFQFVFPRQLAPKTADDLYPYFLTPVVETYREFGIDARLQPLNDIQVKNKKICGTGAATIGNATVLVGSFMFNFDYQTMAAIANAPSNFFREYFAKLLPDYLTTINREAGNTITATDITTRFLNIVSRQFDRAIQIVDPSPQQLQAIAAQEIELVDAEWVNQPGKRLVLNGIKIAANTHLTETTLDTKRGRLTILMVEHKRRIARLTVFIESSVAELRSIQLDEYISGTPLTESAVFANLSSLPERAADIFRDVAVSLLAKKIVLAAHVYPPT